MLKEGTPEIKEQHLKWQAENEAWLQDVNKWQEEYREMLHMLHQVEQVVIEHEQLLDSHTEAITRHGRHVDDLEMALAGWTETGETHDEMMREHEDESQRHEAQKRLHEKLRHQHDSRFLLMQKVLQGFTEGDQEDLL